MDNGMDKELFDKLKNSSFMEELYEQLSQLPDVDLNKDVEFVFGWLKARLVEDVYTKMHENGITKKELVKRLNKKLSYVNRLLNGDIPFTLRFIAELAIALNAKPTVRILNKELHERIKKTKKMVKP